MNKFIYNIKDFTSEEYNLYYSMLCDIRKKKVDRLKLKEDKIRTVAWEMLVKKHFGDDSIITYNENKKPYLLNKKGEFSVSHSKDFVAIAVSDYPVGIDIEAIKPVNIKILKKVLSEKEREYIELSKNPEIAFLEVWTFKEAFYKLKGKISFKEIDYFDDKIKREKIITDDYICHIVY